MSDQPSYFKIGAFVIAVFLLAVATIVVLGAGAFAADPFLVETYFDRSVAGLEVGSKVAFRGVRLGRVQKISLAVDAYPLEPGSKDWIEYGPYIVVVIAVDPAYLSDLSPGTAETRLRRMAERGFRLQMAVQGLTGIAYLDGDYFEPDRYPAVQPPWQPHHHYIPSAPSTFTSIGEALDTITKKLEAIDFGGLVDEVRDSVKALRTEVELLDAGKISERFSKLIDDVNKVVVRVDGILAAGSGEVLVKTERAVDTIGLAATELHDRLASDDFRATLEDLHSLLRRFDQIAANDAGDVEAISANLRQMTDDLRQLVAMLKRYPSQALFGNPPPKRSPRK